MKTPIVHKVIAAVLCVNAIAMSLVSCVLSWQSPYQLPLSILAVCGMAIALQCGRIIARY